MCRLFTTVRRVVPQGTFSCGVATIHLAGDFQLGSAADDRDVQFALDLLDVFVKCTEYCHQQFSLLDLHYLFYGYTLLCLISN